METTKEGGQESHKTKASEIEAGKGMAVLAYLGILALIPYFAEKKNQFVRYHAVQGINIMLIAVGYSIVIGIVLSILGSVIIGGCYTSVYDYYLTGGSDCAGKMAMLGIISFILWIPTMIIGVLCIIGIVNAVQGKEKELPILGKIKIIKK